MYLMSCIVCPALTPGLVGILSPFPWIFLIGSIFARPLSNILHLFDLMSQVVNNATATAPTTPTVVPTAIYTVLASLTHTTSPACFLGASSCHPSKHFSGRQNAFSS